MNTPLHPSKTTVYIFSLLLIIILLFENINFILIAFNKAISIAKTSLILILIFFFVIGCITAIICTSRTNSNDFKKNDYKIIQKQEIHFS